MVDDGRYLNREISWIAFNERVLSEADNEALPLLERLKFHGIAASNLDEFFMVRVAGMMRDKTPEVEVQLDAISERVHSFTARQTSSLKELLRRLDHAGVLVPADGESAFRVTRDSDLRINEKVGQDILRTIHRELSKREGGLAVRLQVSSPLFDTSALCKSLGLDPSRDVYLAPILDIAALARSVSRELHQDLCSSTFEPRRDSPLDGAEDCFEVLRGGDVLLHHPYDSFDTVIDLITSASDDSDVTSIKLTLYRAGGDSRIIEALSRAAEIGKQVTVVVELKARFDEESNIAWAHTLEQSGVRIVFGMLGLKTHAKCLMIVRKEDGVVRRYAHIGTGNYNPVTAKLYTDVGLLTSDNRITSDVASLFNVLTGYDSPSQWNAISVAPLGLHERVIGLIEKEAQCARNGLPSGIVAKMNALVDEDVIESLYRASQAGVPIHILVRGTCCLRPGVHGMSETIEVRSIVDRYLEHARIMHFKNAGNDTVYFGSADWMPRNFHRRIEVMVPVFDEEIRARLIGALALQWDDNFQSWSLESSGEYTRRVSSEGSPTVHAQQRFIEQSRSKN